MSGLSEYTSKLEEESEKLGTRSNGFKKWDTDKVDLTLLPFPALEEIAKVLMYGAEKYGRDNWKLCEDLNDYEKALMRHISAHLSGEMYDEETGLLHLAHVGCNLVFLLYLLRGEDV
jgi:hypothetical protein